MGAQPPGAPDHDLLALLAQAMHAIAAELDAVRDMATCRCWNGVC
jgi:hypothetical protein